MSKNENALKINDLAQLKHITNENVSKIIKERFESRLIFTLIGDILISVNSYCWDEKLYSDAIYQSYLDYNESSPHVFKISASLYRKLMVNKMNQCLIVSGESGSGKTETTKLTLDFLTFISNRKQNVESDLVKKIVAVNPILEAFGNCKTIRNHNSSRFGKWIELYFNDTGTMISANIQNFLLEKSRVTNVKENERNFHIFYLLMAHQSKDISFNLLPDFKKENRARYKHEFEKLVGAALDSDLSEAWLSNIWQILTALLWLGNIEFIDNKEGFAELSSTSKKALKKSSKLLEIEDNDIVQSVTHLSRYMPTGEVTHTKLNAKTSRKSLEALIKAIYSRLFDSLMLKINESLLNSSLASEQKLSIGLLDIFGFEVFAINDFEQLCINFVNEELQTLFNAIVFRDEFDLYKSEGLPLNIFTYSDNSNIVFLLNKLFSFVNEACMLPTGSEKSFLSRSKVSLKNDVNIKFSVKIDGFTIKHYASEVFYTTGQFVSKNRDDLRLNLLKLCQEKTNNVYLKEEIFFKEKRNRSKTVLSKFQSNFKALLNKINTTENSFIRCIKSNDISKPFYFNEEKVNHQLACCGIYEAVKIKQQAFSLKIKFDSFNQRYQVLNLFVKNRHSLSTSSSSFSWINNLKGWDNNVHKYVLGKSMIFMKAKEEKLLENLILEVEFVAATKINNAVKAYLKRSLERRIRKAKEKLNKSLLKRNKAAIIQAYDNLRSLLNNNDNSIKTISLEQEKKQVDSVILSLSKDEGVLEDLFKYAKNSFNLDEFNDVKRCLLQCVKLNILELYPESNNAFRSVELMLSNFENKHDLYRDIQYALKNSDRVMLQQVVTRAKNFKEDLFEDIQELLDSSKSLLRKLDKESVFMVPIVEALKDPKNITELKKHVLNAKNMFTNGSGIPVDENEVLSTKTKVLIGYAIIILTLREARRDKNIDILQRTLSEFQELYNEEVYQIYNIDIKEIIRHQKYVNERVISQELFKSLEKTRLSYTSGKLFKKLSVSEFIQLAHKNCSLLSEDVKLCTELIGTNKAKDESAVPFIIKLTQIVIKIRKLLLDMNFRAVLNLSDTLDAEVQQNEEINHHLKEVHFVCFCQDISALLSSFSHNLQHAEKVRISLKEFKEKLDSFEQKCDIEFEAVVDSMKELFQSMVVLFLDEEKQSIMILKQQIFQISSLKEKTECLETLDLSSLLKTLHDIAFNRIYEVGFSELNDDNKLIIDMLNKEEPTSLKIMLESLPKPYDTTLSYEILNKLYEATETVYNKRWKETAVLLNKIFSSEEDSTDNLLITTLQRYSEITALPRFVRSFTTACFELVIYHLCLEEIETMCSNVSEIKFQLKESHLREAQRISKYLEKVNFVFYQNNLKYSLKHMILMLNSLIYKNYRSEVQTQFISTDANKISPVVDHFINTLQYILKEKYSIISVLFCLNTLKIRYNEMDCKIEYLVERTLEEYDNQPLVQLHLSLHAFVRAKRQDLSLLQKICLHRCFEESYMLTDLSEFDNRLVVGLVEVKKKLRKAFSYLANLKYRESLVTAMSKDKIEGSLDCIERDKVRYVELEKLINDSRQLLFQNMMDEQTLQTFKSAKILMHLRKTFVSKLVPYEEVNSYFSENGFFQDGDFEYSEVANSEIKLCYEYSKEYVMRKLLIASINKPDKLFVFDEIEDKIRSSQNHQLLGVLKVLTVLRNNADYFLSKDLLLRAQDCIVICKNMKLDSSITEINSYLDKHNDQTNYEKLRSIWISNSFQANDVELMNKNRSLKAVVKNMELKQTLAKDVELLLDARDAFANKEFRKCYDILKTVAVSMDFLVLEAKNIMEAVCTHLKLDQVNDCLKSKSFFKLKIDDIIINEKSAKEVRLLSNSQDSANLPGEILSSIQDLNQLLLMPLSTKSLPLIADLSSKLEELKLEDSVLLNELTEIKKYLLDMKIFQDINKIFLEHETLEECVEASKKFLKSCDDSLMQSSSKKTIYFISVLKLLATTSNSSSEDITENMNAINFHKSSIFCTDQITQILNKLFIDKNSRLWQYKMDELLSSRNCFDKDFVANLEKIILSLEENVFLLPDKWKTIILNLKNIRKITRVLLYDEAWSDLEEIFAQLSTIVSFYDFKGLASDILIEHIKSKLVKTVIENEFKSINHKTMKGLKNAEYLLSKVKLDEALFDFVNLVVKISELEILHLEDREKYEVLLSSIIENHGKYLLEHNLLAKCVSLRVANILELLLKSFITCFEVDEICCNTLPDLSYVLKLSENYISLLDKEDQGLIRIIEDIYLSFQLIKAYKMSTPSKQVSLLNEAIASLATCKSKFSMYESNLETVVYKLEALKTKLEVDLHEIKIYEYLKCTAIELELQESGCVVLSQVNTTFQKELVHVDLPVTKLLNDILSLRESVVHKNISLAEEQLLQIKSQAKVAQLAQTAVMQELINLFKLQSELLEIFERYNEVNKWISLLHAVKVNSDSMLLTNSHLVSWKNSLISLISFILQLIEYPEIDKLGDLNNLPTKPDMITSNGTCVYLLSRTELLRAGKPRLLIYLQSKIEENNQAKVVNRLKVIVEENSKSFVDPDEINVDLTKISNTEFKEQVQYLLSLHSLARDNLSSDEVNKMKKTLLSSINTRPNPPAITTDLSVVTDNDKSTPPAQLHKSLQVLQANILKMLEERSLIRDIEQVRKDTCVKFDQGYIDISTIEITRLEEILSEVSSSNNLSEFTKLDNVYKHHVLLLNCRKALLNESWPDVKMLLKDFDIRFMQYLASSKYKISELEDIKFNLSLYEENKELLLELDEYRKERNLDKLSETIELCKDRGLFNKRDNESYTKVLSSIEVVNKLNNFLFKINFYLTNINNEDINNEDINNEDIDIHDVEELIDNCYKYNYITKEVLKLEEYKNKIKIIFKDIYISLNEVNINKLSNIQIYCKQQNIKLYSLQNKINKVLSLPNHHLQKLKLDSAIKRKDRITISEVILQIKNRYFEQHDNKLFYKLREYPHLAKCSSSMLVIDYKEDIVKLETSISVLNTLPLINLSIKCHRASKRCLEEIWEVEEINILTEVGEKVEEIRDELFLSIIKVIQTQKDKDRISKGFQLMKHFLSTFGPSEEFQNYFELWIRTKTKELHEDLEEELLLKMYDVCIDLS